MLIDQKTLFFGVFMVLSLYGCSRPECPVLTEGGMDVKEAVQVEAVQKWGELGAKPDVEGSEQQICQAIEEIHRSPEAVADWMTLTSEESLSAFSRTAKGVVGRYGDKTRAQLGEGLGVVLGMILKRGSEKVDQQLYFRAGVLFAHLSETLRSMEKPGLVAFSNGVLQVLPKPERMGNVEELSNWVQVQDLLFAAGGPIAEKQGADAESWTTLLSAFVSGRMTVQKP